MPILVYSPLRQSDFFSCFVVQTLLIDGYISQTFLSRASEMYFLNLLKSTSIPTHSTSSNTRREGYFFVHSVPPHISSRFPSSPGRWLLDRGIVDGGTVVPQVMWSPYSPSHRRKHVEMGKLLMPVFFEVKDRVLGLSLEASVDGQCRVLRDANVPAPLSQKTTTHFRIIVSMAIGCFVVAC